MHDKRLSQYFRKTTRLILPLLIAFVSLALCGKKRNGRSAIIFSIFSVISLLLSVVPLLYTGNVQDNRNSGFILKRLSVAAYLSYISLTITAISLAAILDTAYIALASPALLLEFLLMLFLIYSTHSYKFEEGNWLYYTHAIDLAFFFDISSEVTQSTFFGLSAALLGYSKSGRYCQQQQGKHCRQLGATSPRAAEALTVYANIIGLLMMIVCSMPLAITGAQAMENIVKKFLRFGAYLQIVLVAQAAFVAAVTFLQGYIVAALAVVIMVAIIWLRKLYCGQNRIQARPPPLAQAQQPPAHYLRNNQNVQLWPGIYPGMFGVLMVAYSAYDICQHVGGLYKMAVFLVFAAIVGNLARIVILREGGQWSEVLMMVSAFVTIGLMALAVTFIILLVFLRPGEVRSTFIATANYSGLH